MADRAKILATELRRGPAADLVPYLATSGHPTLRRLAIRALGRIGDRAGAPPLIAAGLREPGNDLVPYLEAAGLSAAASLVPAVLPHAGSKDPAVAAAALEALGWIGGDDVVAALGRGLHRSESIVVAAALEGLARAKAEGYLERCLRFAEHKDSDVQLAAAFAAWMLAAARRTAVVASGATWEGDARLAADTYRAMRGEAFGLHGVRPLGILIEHPSVDAVPDRSVNGNMLTNFGGRVAGGDRRVGQEVLARVYGPRQGSEVERGLTRALAVPDPITRQAALEASAAKPRSQAFLRELQARATVEEDPRVREALAVTLAKLGDEPGAAQLLARKDRPEDAGLRLLTELRVLGASKRETATQELVALADAHKDRPAVVLEALSLLEEKPGAAATSLIDCALDHADAVVRSAAAGLVAKHKLSDRFARLTQLLDAPFTYAETDVRQAVFEAWADLLKSGALDKDAARRLLEDIAKWHASDPSYTARAVARATLKEQGVTPTLLEDPLQPNDWKGLPRPKEPLLGIDLTKGSGPLTEAEILTLADRMGEERPEFVVECDVGSFRLAIDPSEAPVHAVSFLLCVASGVYEGTPWHRVVPSFVIQGGDPHGTGSGDAGWHLPDEITRGRFVRGALGMPKGAIRDTGGCQLFVMHSDYRPLDGRYTCYGRVTDGMDTVDKIRIGDKIVRVARLSR
jgi:cyclophilin family peptidyl-prolyl cis-trans isomerase/HEAT repeat protein